MTLCQELSTIPSLQTPKPPGAGASPSLKLTVATVRTDPSVIWIARTLLSAATYTVSPRSTMRVEFLSVTGARQKIGRASCRERVEIGVVAVSIKKNALQKSRNVRVRAVVQL